MKRIAAAVALMCAATGCEKPVPILPLNTLADVPGGGRVHFNSATFPPSATTQVGAIHEQHLVWGDVALPQTAGRVPAVILVHGCAGVRPALRRWAEAVNGAGYAAFTLDSFAGRDIGEVCTGARAINTASVLSDIYRAQVLLASHPRIDPARIAVLGFGLGGRAALWAALVRFQRVLAAPDLPPLAAYLAFYPDSCRFQFRDETEIRGGPVRLFHGTADDAAPLIACRAWAARMRAAGHDVGIYEYAGAQHGFDDAAFAPPRRFAEHVNLADCDFGERPDGSFLDKTTGARPGAHAACATEGYTQGYDATAHERSIEDAKTFLAAAFRRGGG